jgi:hypothetical protein
MVTEVTDGRGRRSDRAFERLADYVYGTIATLVAILGLTFDTHPDALTAGAVIIVGAVAIWLAHGLSQLVAERSRQAGSMPLADIVAEFRTSWPIVSAAVPATLVMLMAEFGVYSTSTGLGIAQIVGVLALAGVGVATAGGSKRPVVRRIGYVALVTGVGVLIVVMEAAAHSL